MSTVITDRLERERTHFNRIAESRTGKALVMPASNILRYDHPSADTPFPLEYAFHLLGDLHGKTVVDIGCGEGLNTVILASLGATVFSVDISDKSLENMLERARANGVDGRVKAFHSDAATIPVEDNQADGVLCAAILHHVDCVATARQIKRILKPGGTAVFLEPMVGPNWFSSFKKLIPEPADVTPDEQPLTQDQVDSVIRNIGSGGRQREFRLTTRLVERIGVQSFSVLQNFYRLDGWILKHVPPARRLASPVVWEARKA